MGSTTPGRRYGDIQPLEPRRLLAVAPFYTEPGRAGEMLSNLDGAEFAAVGVQKDGRILTVTIRDEASLVLTRRLPNGKLDRSFGVNGSVVSSFRDGIILNHVRVLPNDKLLVAGSIGDPALTSDGDDNILLMRLNSRGIPDPTFGVRGVATVSFGKDTYETGTYVDVSATGRIILSGRLDTHSADTAHAVFAAFTPEGLVDKSFASAGRMRLQNNNLRVSTAGTLRFLPGGSLLLQATQRMPKKTRNTFILARLTPRGAYDGTFGRRGFAQVPVAWGENTPEASVLPDGRILLGQLRRTDEDDDPRNEPAVFMRLLTTGAVDSTFGDDGTLTDPTLPSRLERADTAIASRIDLIQSLSNDSFLVAVRGPVGFLLARYDASGLDTSFGDKGTTTTPFDERADAVTMVQPQRDGKLLLAGVARDPEIASDAAGWLARFSAKGLADARFGRIYYDQRRTEAQLVNVPGRLRVIGTDQDDEIHLVIDGDTDTYSVKVNGTTLAAGVASHIFSSGVAGGGLSIDARRGDDTVSITSNVDVPVTVFGGQGSDHLFGSRSRDLLFGGAGDDLLMGEGDDDTLVGNSGVDLLFGGDQDDTLYAREGKDVAEGNRGTDVIVNTPGADPTFG